MCHPCCQEFNIRQNRYHSCLHGAYGLGGETDINQILKCNISAIKILEQDSDVIQLASQELLCPEELE